jgi:hypothetical protein
VLQKQSGESVIWRGHENYCLQKMVNQEGKLNWHSFRGESREVSCHIKCNIDLNLLRGMSNFIIDRPSICVGYLQHQYKDHTTTSVIYLYHVISLCGDIPHLLDD